MFNLFKKKVDKVETKGFWDTDINEYAIWDGKVSGSSILSNISEGDLIKLYKGWIYACVDVRSDGIANLKPKLFASKDKINSTKESEILDLISWDLLKAVSSFLDLLGSVYLLKERVGSKITGLKVLRTDSIKVKQDLEGNILFYTYHSNNREYIFQKDDIISIHKFNPEEKYPNLMNGISPAMAVAKQQLMDLFSIEWNYLFFKEGGKPGTILTTEKQITEEAKKKLTTRWKEFFAGLKNSHKVAVLDNGLQYQSTTTGQREMEFSEQRKFTREEILNIFRVPLPLLGKSDGVGFADRKVPEYYFQKYALVPQARQIENAFNEQLFKGEGYFSFGKIVNADISEYKELYSLGAMGKNELRSLYDLPDLVDGDVDVNGEPIKTRTKEVKKIEVKLDKSVLKRAITKAKKKIEKRTDDEKEVKWQEMRKRVSGDEKKMEQQIKSIFDRQEKIIIANYKKDKKAIFKKGLFDDFVMGVMWITSGLKGTIKTLMIKEGTKTIEDIGGKEKLDFSKLDPWLTSNIRKFGKDIDKNTKKEILSIIKKGDDLGLGEDQIVKNITKKFSEYKTSRVKKIVRTESSRAINRANLEAFKQMEVEKMEWYTSQSERVCPHCKSMNGKTFKVGETIFERGTTMSTGLKLDYEPIKHPPLHTNCQCTILYAD